MTTDRLPDTSGEHLGRVLVPLDGSPLSARVLDLAARLPARELILLQVVPEGLSLLPGRSTRDHEDEARERAAELEALAGPLRSGERTVAVEVRFGDAADEILEAAADCDLVVMVTRGRGAAGRILFGSTADRVSRYSPTPTLLVRVNDDQVPDPSRIVVPLDGSALAERAMPLGATMARGLAAPLHLVRAVGLDEVRATIHEQRSGGEGDGTEETYEAARELTEQEARDYLAEVAAGPGDQGLEVTSALLQGTPVFALLDAIRPDDLVVMTSHGRGGFRRWMLGSVAEKLVRESSAPVLLVPTREEASPAGSGASRRARPGS